MDIISRDPEPSKGFNRLFTAAVVVWVLGVILGLGMIGGGIWVAVHFLSKIW